MRPYIPIVLGTARQGRYSVHVADMVFSIAQTFDIETELIDVKDFDVSRTIPSWEESDKTKLWKDVTMRAHGFVFVVPEYNRSFPGEFKLLLDMAHKEYAGKAVGVIGVSSGKIGGARMIEHLNAIFTYLEMRVAVPSVYVGLVQQLIDKEPKESLHAQYDEDIKKMITKIISLTNI